MSIAKSFFDITTGRSHGVVPTSDAVRIILDSGAAVLLDRLPITSDGQHHIRATAAIAPVGLDKDGMRLTFDIAHTVTEDRVDKALSALVKKMVLGESGVEVTEWTVPEATVGGSGHPFVQFGRISVLLFQVNPCGGSIDDEIVRLLVNCVEAARRDQGDHIINAAVVRAVDHENMVGIACFQEKPTPPVGATLTARRVVGVSPRVDVPWSEIMSMGRLGFVEQAVKTVRRDCKLIGLDVTNMRPAMFLLFINGREEPIVVVKAPNGEEMLLDSLSWTPDILGMAVKSLAGFSVAELDNLRGGALPIALRVKAVRRDHHPEGGQYRPVRECQRD